MYLLKPRSRNGRAFESREGNCIVHAILVPFGACVAAAEAVKGRAEVGVTIDGFAYAVDCFCDDDLEAYCLSTGCQWGLKRNGSGNAKAKENEA